MEAPRLNVDGHSSNSSSATNSYKCDQRTSILLASIALSLPNSDQEKRILLASVGDWEPVMLSSLDGRSYYSLTSQENIQDVLVDQPVGQWTPPVKIKSATEERIATDGTVLLQHFITSSLFYKSIPIHNYKELSKPTCQSINRDWQYRYAVSQLFAGAILIEQSSAILLNCVEPCGRLKKYWYTLRTKNCNSNASFFIQKRKYGWMTVIQTQEDNTTNLKIGTTFNLLGLRKMTNYFLKTDQYF